MTTFKVLPESFSHSRVSDYRLPVAIFTAFTLFSCSHKVDDRPNIILILSDDMGIGDLAIYNEKDGFPAPAIESIAKQGVRFTSFYSNGAECTPTRAALLTGRYQQRIGGLECALGSGNVGRYDDAIRLRETNDLGLPVNETSVARILKDAGYSTGMTGKWHLGYEPKFHPNRHGFDYTFYELAGGMDYFHHMDMEFPEHLLYLNGKPVDREGYFTDLTGEEAVKFIDSQDKKTPFFLYVAFTAVHAPFQGPDDYLPEILPANSPLWNQSLGQKDVYLSMLKRMDETIGKILEKLNERGLADNTIVIFTNDNGGTRTGSNYPLRGWKGELFEGGIRVPCVVSWPGRISPGIISDQPAMTIDLTASIIRVAKATLPENRSLDGIDILKLVEEKSPVTDRTLFWRARRGDVTRKSVRSGDLKYIKIISKEKTDEFSFDLSKDPYEKTNMADSIPENTEKLKKLLDDWEVEVKPVR